jgi:serine/threonine protein kinase
MLDFKQVKEIFLAAVERADPKERESYLQQACGDDAQLRRRVEALLRRHEQPDNFPEQPALDPEGILTAASPHILDASLQQDTAGTRLGPSKLLQKIGEGGMGAVWMAEQQEPVRRLVAVKVIRAGLDSGQAVARFEAERQALALMSHPNIAQILDGGTTADGRPYLVMELLEGTPITRYCDDHRLTLRQRLELFLLVCQAVQHAHQKGIIHRDIKPSNVLVVCYDERAVPKVIDFGIAKAAGPRLTERTLDTAVGVVVGTLEYMSPEQTGLNNLDIDTRSDVYSLGVLLYELLTGATPLIAQRRQKASLLEVLQAIREEEPPRPSTWLGDSTDTLPAISAQRRTDPAKLRRLVRGELDWIVMKTLEKERGRRYDTANGLARDIERYLNDEPVEAGPPSPGYRLRKLLRRHRGRVTAAGGILVALVLGLVGTTLFALRARDSARQADEERNKAVAEKERADREADAAWANQYIAHMNRVESDWEHGNVSRVLDTLALYRKPPPERKDPRGWEWHYQDRLCHQELRALKGHTDKVMSVAFSPDGTRLASAGRDKMVKVWDAASGQEFRTLQGHTGQAMSVAFSPDGTRLASAGRDQTVKVWDVASGEQLLALQGHAGEVYSVAFSPDGTRLASAGLDQTVKVWDAASGQQLRTLKGHTSGVKSVAFSPDGTRLASAGWDKTVKVWDPASGQELRTLQGHTGPVPSVAFSPDGTRLASADVDQTVKVWDPASGQELRTLKGHTGPVPSVAFSPDGTRLASGSEDKTVKVWDARPLTPAVQAEVEALALLEVLFSRPLPRTEVRAALNKQVILSEAARKQALELAARFREETDPQKYLAAAWPVVRHPHANVFLCEFAVAQMKDACRLAPDQPTYRRALGVAQYRLGKFHAKEHANALATLLKGDQNDPTTLAFLAMSQFQDGQKKQARSTLARLRELNSKPPWSTDAEAASFLREAAALIEDRPAQPRP